MIETYEILNGLGDSIRGSPFQLEEEDSTRTTLIYVQSASGRHAGMPCQRPWSYFQEVPSQSLVKLPLHVPLHRLKSNGTYALSKRTITEQ